MKFIQPQENNNNFLIAYKLKGSEIECPKTKTIRATQKLLDCWEELRVSIDEPIIINSGFRTIAYHIELYRRKFPDTWKDKITTHSAHLTGEALDMKVPLEMETEKFMEECKKAGFTYVYDITGKSRGGDVHADVKRR